MNEIIDNNHSKFLTLFDIQDMELKEKIKLGKIPTITMCLVDGEWVIDDGKKSLVEREVTKTIEIPKKQWFNLKESSKLKGINYKTLCNKPYLKPNGGEPDGIVAGRKAWKLETILTWLNQTDDKLKELYRKKKKS